jgi:hypothetical protein
MDKITGHWDQAKGDGMGRTCSTLGGEEDCVVAVVALLTCKLGVLKCGYFKR